MPDETPSGWLERIDDEEKKAALRDDVRALGLAGTVVLLAQPGPEDPSIAREAVEAVKGELARGAGGEGGSVRALVARYAEKKGARGPELARKVIGRTLHDLYGLEGHGLTADDTARALDLAARLRGDADAREAARALARFGRTAARVVLGHLEEQIHLVHRLQTDELMPSELDRPILEFAPRIFAGRFPAVLKLLLPQEPKVRLAFVLWARLRGLSIGKEALVHALDALVPERPGGLVDAVAKLDRAPLLALARSEDALALEDGAFLPLA